MLLNITMLRKQGFNSFVVLSHLVRYFSEFRDELMDVNWMLELDRSLCDIVFRMIARQAVDREYLVVTVACVRISSLDVQVREQLLIVVALHTLISFRVQHVAGL